LPNLSNFKNFEEKDEPETPIKLQIQKETKPFIISSKKAEYMN
jgi:hypothetical protein